MKIFLSDGSTDVLEKRSFVASGGQGNIYLKGSTVYKIYLDPQFLIPEQKIKELSVLDLPYIVRPQQIIYNDQRKPVGYTMAAVRDTVALCQVFTRAYKDRAGVRGPQIEALVAALRAGVAHCHARRVLIVDLNEMNFLVDAKTHDRLWFIDVDSYQTPGFPATAIMESIRDRQAKTWSEGSDWFSFAVLAFQLWIGIHPYRGRHPKVTALDDRMKANLSVLNKDVSTPPVCAPLTVIPPNYLEWFTRVFERGERLAPPEGFGAVVVVVRAKSGGKAQAFKVVPYRDYVQVLAPQGVRKMSKPAPYTTHLTATDSTVVGYQWLTGTEVTELTDSLVVDNARHKFEVRKPRGSFGIGMLPTAEIVIAYIEGGRLRMWNAMTGQPVGDTLDIAVDHVWGWQGRIYAKADDKIYTLVMVSAGAGDRVFVSIREIAQCMPLATRVFPGVVIQDILGNYFASFMPEAGIHYQPRLDELKGMRVVDAAGSGRLLVVLAESRGVYSRLVFRFNADYQAHDCRREDDVALSGVNALALPSGVCLAVNGGGQTEVFRCLPGDTQMKVVDDQFLADKPIFAHDTQVVAADGDALVHVSLA